MSAETLTTVRGGGIPMMVIELGPYPMFPENADVLVDQLGDVAGQTVIVDSRAVIHVEQPFADRLVERMFGEKQAAELTLVWAHHDLWRDMHASLAARGLPGRITYAPVRIMWNKGLRKVS